MEGTAYTVVDESGEILPFHVEIVGTYDEGSSTNRIMAKASGPVVERTGGTLQGMSGSPVYIDGALVGALSAGIKGMNLYTFFITPIDEMLPIWDMPDYKAAHLKKEKKEKKEAKEDALENAAEKAAFDSDESKDAEMTPEDGKKQNKPEKASAEPLDNSSETVDKEKSSKKEPKEEVNKEPVPEEKEQPKEKKTPPAKKEQTDKNKPAPEEKDNTPDEKPVTQEADAAFEKEAETKEKSAIYLAGFGKNARSYMQDKLSAIGFKAAEMPSFGIPTPGTHVVYDAELLPGSAIGVAVSYGDFSVGATGTVTAVDDKRVLAFGHPFLHKGNVNYFMTEAKVVGTISGPTDGMKIASIGNIIGRINQDREAGVAGILGSFPESVPMRVRVKDVSLGYDRKFTAQIAYDEDFLPILVPGIAYAAMSKTSDTVGEATASLKFTIRTTAGEDGRIERSNMYYNIADVGQASVGEIAQMIALLCQDTDEEADVTAVDVDIEMESVRKTASLISAVPEKPSAKPGETVNLRTTIKPFRKEKEEVMIPYHISETQAPGVLSLDVRGGGFIPVTTTLLQNALGIDTSAEEDKTQTTAEKVKQFLELGKNNEIIVAPAIAPHVPSSSEEKKEVNKRPKKAEKKPKQQKKPQRRVDLLGQEAKKQEESLETKFETGYVIDNVIHASLLIEEEDKK